MRRNSNSFLPCWWECIIAQPSWKMVWCVLKNLNAELPYDSAVLLLDIYPKELKTETWTDTHTPMFITALFTTAKRQKQQPKCLSVGEWINEMWSVHTMDRYSALKKNEILIRVTTYMNLEDIMLREISQSRKNKYCMIPFTWGTWSQTHRDRKQERGRGLGRKEWGADV